MTIQTMSFRLYGVNTPEVIGANKAAGLKAKEFVEKTIPVGTEILIRTFKDKKEKYGRYLCDVVLESADSGKTLSKLLIEKGLATEYFGIGEKV